MSRPIRRTYPPAVLNIPHASTWIPENVRGTLVPGPEALEIELLRMTDHLTDRLFELPASLACPIVCGVSRLVVDVERYTDDALEPMAAVGMGAVYTRTSGGDPLRRGLTTAQRDGLLEEYYYTHHAALTKAVERALMCHSRCLLLDCHSFASDALPHEPDQRANRPEICIGTDPFHTPPELTERATALFEAAGFATAVNFPFSGALVPERFHRKHTGVRAIMVEVNRSLYVDEEAGAPLPDFDRFQARLAGVLTDLITAA
jgi:N-formylglutamate deformylase